MPSFSSDKFMETVRQAARNAHRNTLRTLQIYIELQIEDLVYTTPIDTGRLAGSWRASLNAPVSDPPYQWSPTPSDAIRRVLSVAEGMTLEDKIYVLNTAPYAARVEYGFVGTDTLGRTYNQRGRYTVAASLDRAPMFAQTAARLAANR